MAQKIYLYVVFCFLVLFEIIYISKCRKLNQEIKKIEKEIDEMEQKYEFI
jgi:uncharacterized protein Yka (UPF0111/DUF47 family)